MSAENDRPDEQPRSAARAWLGRQRRWLHEMRAERRAGRARMLDGGMDRPPAPPHCPAGWRTGPPDFIGIGVQRCGTTRWFDLIASHPEVVTTLRQRELHYFDRFYAGHTAQDIAGYHDYFPRDERTTGEWTPLYLSAPWIPSMLAQAAPDARLLVIVRDPVERYLSGLELDARVAARRGAPLSRYAPLEAFVRGLYHGQLQRLLGCFDRSQLLLLQYERCTRDPLPELRRTFEFLGLSDIDFAADVSAHPKRQREKPQLAPDTREAYVGAYTEDVLRLAADFPEIDLALWPNFAHLAGASSPS
jgi:hypothetical protein